MENDQVFEADASMANQQSTSLSPPPDKKRRGGQGDTVSKYGAIESRKTFDEEDTPLLERLIDHQSDTASHSTDEDESRPPPTWYGERDFEGLPWWKSPSIFWLLPPFLLFTLAFGGVIVPELDLILTLICKDYLSERAASDPTFHFTPVMFGTDNPQCASNPEVQALAAKFTLYRGLISGILASIVAPKIGVASDRYGRKKLIAYTTFGMLAVEVIRIMAASYPETFSVNWILLGSALDGLCGSFISAMAVSNAYTADCTEPSKRAVRFGYFHACLFTGIAVGPILAGYIVAGTGKLITIFWVALGAQLFFLCFVLLAVPESLTKERQLAARQKKDHVGAGEAFSWTFASSIRRFSQATTFQRSNTGSNNGSGSWSWSAPLSSLFRGVYGIFTPLSILWPTGPGSSRAVRRNLVFLAAVDTIMFGVTMGSVVVVIYYAKFVFGWRNFESQRFLSIVNTCRVTVLLIVLPLISRLVRGPRSRFTQRNSGSDGLDLAMIRVAIAFDMIGYAGYTLSQNGAMLTLSGAIASVGGMGSPTLQSSLTKHVPPDRVGQLLGAMGLLHALARVVAPTIFNLIYAKTVVKGFPQAVFVCLTATFGVAFLLSWFIRPHVYLDDPDPPTHTNTTVENEALAPEEVG